MPLASFLHHSVRVVTLLPDRRMGGQDLPSSDLCFSNFYQTKQGQKTPYAQLAIVTSTCQHMFRRLLRQRLSSHVVSRSIDATATRSPAPQLGLTHYRPNALGLTQLHHGAQETW